MANKDKKDGTQNVTPARAPVRPKGASALWGSVPFALVPNKSQHGQITAVSMMKDEGPFVLEWIAHHLAVGFTDLVVYTNDCSDGTDDMLIRLEHLGLCHHRRNEIPDGVRPQPSALNYAQEEPVVLQSDWVMVFDADEFVSIKHGDGTLEGMISDAVAKGANGIVITWRIFGSGGIVSWSRAPVTEQYLMAAPQTWNKGWGVKTLFKFDSTKWKLGIHRPKIKTKWIETDFPDQVKWLNGSGNEMEDYFKFRGWRSITRTVGYDWVQLNHYAVKSVDSYAIRKLRGNVNNKKDKYNSDYWSLQDRNEVADDTMLRYSVRRNQIFQSLLTDPMLSDLHYAAIGRAEARLDELRKTPAYDELVASLTLASAVPISQIVAKPPQARDKEKIAALMSDVEKKRGAKAKLLRKSTPDHDQTSAVPMGSYHHSPSFTASDITSDWFVNHSLSLPADPAIFAAHALPLIQAGKFERGLARRMPQVLDPSAKVLELGSAVGFLAGHCVNLRPDLTWFLQEDDRSLLQMMQAVFAISERTYTDTFMCDETRLSADLASDAAALISARSPDALLIGDGRFSAQVLAQVLGLLGAGLPDQLFLYGRQLEANWADIEPITDMLLGFGFVADYGFDPNICRGFRLASRHVLKSDA